jgi:hypothetical protein
MTAESGFVIIDFFCGSSPPCGGVAPIALAKGAGVVQPSPKKSKKYQVIKSLSFIKDNE